ncbi:hypothetical protein N752_06765 [Desulforamulus aquiferis]|nr:DUF1850 domain-containing protein [Desulforamulus aquiferis]RYD05941.1 hypothetical protein N752_06765 [Desulforamulus aquiferis]
MLGLFLITLFFLPLPVLTVAEKDKFNQILIPMVLDKTFTIEYIHSVQKTPVQEKFILAPGNKIILTETTFQSFGVGTPFLADEGTLVNKNGTFVLTDLSRSFESINLGFLPLTKHTIVYRNDTYNFSDYFKPNSLIIVQAEQYTPAKIIWQVLGCRREVRID